MAWILVLPEPAPAEWQASRTLSQTGATQRIGDLKLGARGELFGAWTRPNPDMPTWHVSVVAQGTTDGTFASPQLLSNPAISEPGIDNQPTAARLAFNDSGVGVAAWTSRAPLPGGASTFGRVVATSREPGQPFAATQTIDSPRCHVHTAMSNAAGDRAILYECPQTTESASPTDLRVASRPAGAPSFGAPQIVVAGLPYGSAVFAAATLAPSGKVTVAWSQGRTPRVADGSVAGGSFEPPTDVHSLSGRANSPRIGTDASGNAIVVWWEQISGTFNFSLRASCRSASSSSWSASTLVSSVGSFSVGSTPTLDVAGDGGVRIAYTRSTSSTKQDALEAVEGTTACSFDAPQLVASAQAASDAQIRSPQVATNADGQAVLVWMDHSGSVPANSVMRAATAGTAGPFGTATTISDRSQVLYEGPEAVIDEEGNAIVMWAEYLRGANGNVVSYRLQTASHLSDARAPAVSIRTPGDGAHYAHGASVAADFACADEQGGSGIASCEGTVANGQPIATSTLGIETFTVTAIDGAGNRTSETVTYTVVDPDRDGDGVENSTDNCPDDVNVDQRDIDGDDAGDVCDPDRDGDDVPNSDDNCDDAPNPTQADADHDRHGDVCDDDRDGDGIVNLVDNCADVANGDQADNDSDGLGDDCDADRDGDDIPDSSDNCPQTANAAQADADGDTVGDVCDGDRDGDGIANPQDNCADVPNPEQGDDDADDIGDACDAERAAAYQISVVIDTIAALDINDGMARSLTAKLRGALESANAGDLVGACRRINSFVQEVNAQAGKQLSADESAALLEDAARISRALGCAK